MDFNTLDNTNLDDTEVVIPHLDDSSKGIPAMTFGDWKEWDHYERKNVIRLEVLGGDRNLSKHTVEDTIIFVLKERCKTLEEKRSKDVWSLIGKSAVVALIPAILMVCIL